MKSALTLIELLVVIAIIAVLAALLLPALSRAKSSARQLACVGNVRQVNLAVHMYADDHGDDIAYYTNKIYFDYKQNILSYLAGNGNASSNSTVFICAADDFDLSGPIGSWILDASVGRGFHNQVWSQFSSYWFNGLTRGSNTNELGMAQKPFASVREPARTELIGEISGGMGLSGHDRLQPLQFQNARNVMSFVDGDVSYIKMFWSGTAGFDSFPAFYDPPDGYDYKWAGN